MTKDVGPAFSRGWTAGLAGLLWCGVAGGFALAVLKFLVLLSRMENPRRALSAESEALLLGLVTAAAGVLAVGFAVRGLLTPFTERYRVGAADLTVRRGVLWQRTTTIPLICISRIETSTGPVMRLLGLTDLVVVAILSREPRTGTIETASVVLQGLRGGEEMRRFLLDRKESLGEAAIGGDDVIVSTPQDLQVHRLARAIERLERRLSRPST